MMLFFYNKILMVDMKDIKDEFLFRLDYLGWEQVIPKNVIEIESFKGDSSV